MYIGEKVRHLLFKLKDNLGKEKVYSFVSELETISKTADLKSVIENKLQHLLRHAGAKVVFYQRLNLSIDLRSYPVISKRQIAAEYASFLSEGFDKETLVPVSTSGSYGTPLTFYLTTEKKKRQWAEVIFYGKQCGYDVGNRYGYFRSVSYKSKLKEFSQNEFFFSSKYLNVEFVERGIKVLRENRIKTLIGFPSAISYLAKACIEKGYSPADFNLKGVVTGSENLTLVQRRTIEKAFGCPVHSRYSTEELGVLGVEKNERSGFDLNTGNYIIEVLALDRDESVKVGEVGRVVVTDLHSNALPLIRYETGDLAQVGSFLDEARGWVAKLDDLSGRAVQLLYDTKGTTLYPLFLDTIMEQFDCFHQYQMIQESEISYTLKIIPNQYYQADLFDINHVKKQFHEWLGKDAELDIQWVNDLETLPSGKRPYVINKLRGAN